jgi:hypothetical protein
MIYVKILHESYCQIILNGLILFIYFKNTALTVPGKCQNYLNRIGLCSFLAFKFSFKLTILLNELIRFRNN